jgi:lipopolysaccharide transport system permease protein
MLGLILWFAASVVVTGTIRLSVFALPLLLLPLLFWAVGLTFLTSAVGVFVRDVSQVVGMLTTLLLFFSPVFYPVTALPGWLQPLMELNPLAFVIESARAAKSGLLFDHDAKWLFLWLVHMAIGTLVMIGGVMFFQTTRRGFADVL